MSQEKLEDVILPEKRAEWDQLRSEDCTDNFTAKATDNFFPRTCYNARKKHDKRDLGLFKEEFRCAEILRLCSKTYCCYDRKSNYKFSSKGLKKRTLEDCGDGPMSKYRKVLQEAVNVILTNRGFRKIQHSVATYEQTKRIVLLLSIKNSRRRWNTHKTFTLVNLIIALIVCPFLHILINFFKILHNLFT